MGFKVAVQSKASDFFVIHRRSNQIQNIVRIPKPDVGSIMNLWQGPNIGISGFELGIRAIFLGLSRFLLSPWRSGWEIFDVFDCSATPNPFMKIVLLFLWKKVALLDLRMTTLWNKTCSESCGKPQSFTFTRHRNMALLWPKNSLP